MPQRRLICLLFQAASTALATFAMTGTTHADDQPFFTVYTTDIQPQHGRELEQWFSWKAGHAAESANEFRSRTELEYGITDDVQGALYLNYDWSRERRHAPSGPAESAGFVGVSGELIWRVLNVYFDPIGLAFYVEPSLNAREYSVETKILVHKNFFDQRLRGALNINFEDVWEKNALGTRDASSALEFNAGLSYNITPDFSAGVEFDNERGFDGLVLGGSAAATSDSYFFGPTIQYIGHPWAITLGAQAQLPWAGNPGHVPTAVSGGYSADIEHFRVALRVSSDF
jgi:hypothetical protein